MEDPPVFSCMRTVRAGFVQLVPEVPTQHFNYQIFFQVCGNTTNVDGALMICMEDESTMKHVEHHLYLPQHNESQSAEAI